MEMDDTSSVDDKSEAEDLDEQKSNNLDQLNIKGSNLRLTVAGDSDIFTSCSGC